MLRSGQNRKFYHIESRGKNDKTNLIKEHLTLFFLERSLFIYESTRGLAEKCWTHIHYTINVVRSSPATASVFVSLGKILNLKLLRWPERIWDLHVGCVECYNLVLMGRGLGRLQIVLGEAKCLWRFHDGVIIIGNSALIKWKMRYINPIIIIIV